MDKIIIIKSKFIPTKYNIYEQIIIYQYINENNIMYKRR